MEQSGLAKISESSSRLLDLPGEVRQKIWSRTVPSEAVIDIKFCSDRCLDDIPRNNASPIGRLLQRAAQKETLHSELGLNVRLINRQIRAEAQPLLSAKTFRFCCIKCYSEFLHHLRTKRAGFYWMRRVQIGIDLANSLHGRGYHRWMIGAPMNVDIVLLRMMLLEQLAEIKKWTYRHYGRLDLLERDEWSLPELTGTCHEYVLMGHFNV